MKVASGLLKGRAIPFINARFDNADVTPQKIKEALFSILGNDLSGRSFLDLYACSGQIGIEALSRGAAPVIFNEIDRRRFAFIRTIINEWGLNEAALCYNLPAFPCLKLLAKHGYRFDIIFIDPPYDKRRAEAPRYDGIMREVGKYPIVKPGGTVAVQHFGANTLPELSGPFHIRETRRYGSSALSFYSAAADGTLL